MANLSTAWFIRRDVSLDGKRSFEILNERIRDGDNLPRRVLVCLGLLENRPSQQWILPIRLIGIWLRRRGMKEIAAYNDLQVRRHNWDNEKTAYTDLGILKFRLVHEAQAAIEQSLWSRQAHDMDARRSKSRKISTSE
jgi:hypothetical protein